MMFEYKDYYEKYGRIMQFNKNKKEPIHRWYPFVEGYSKEFIQSILSEMNRKNLICLEPFSGSGTTALELQNSNITCYSFEVNPLMYNIAKVKLENTYEYNEVVFWLGYIKDNRSCMNINISTPFSTLYEKKGKKKWNYSKKVGIAIEKLRVIINSITENKYRELFLIALSAILLDVSNLYRNGKCLSYKKDWEKRNITEEDVFKRFDNKVLQEILVDIKNMKPSKLSNKPLLFNKDSRCGIENEVADNTIDLVITSPPYLNSRDYTDTYILELKTLGFTKTYQDIRKLREKTLRSHVQIKWKDETSICNELLEKTINELQEAIREEKTWNNSIIDMIRLYFVDMQTVFRVLYKKMKSKGRIYFNVSNSAYFNVLINTLEICALIAENEGFKIIEIRKARKLKTSPQQKKEVEKLLEGVIVMEK